GLQRLEVAPRHLEHVGHYAEEPGRELRLAEQRLHSLRDALEVALELEQGLQAGLGGRRLFPQPRERRVRRRELRSEIFQAPLDLGQHPPRLLELGFESGAPLRGVAGSAPDRSETRLRLPQPLPRGLEALAQQLLALADALARAALLGLGREQVERELLLVGDHAAALS